VRILLILGLLAVASSTAADKREWQTGKTLSSERLERPCGNGKTCTYQEFKFQGESKTYTAREALNWGWSKEANVTVGGPVKFAVDARERKLTVADDQGKNHDMEIVSKALSLRSQNGNAR
jgi:hypothetical protein